MTTKRTALFWLFTILGAIVLFGSLVTTSITNEPMYFIVGYPVAGFFLLIAGFMTRKVARR